MLTAACVYVVVLFFRKSKGARTVVHRDSRAFKCNKISVRKQGALNDGP